MADYYDTFRFTCQHCGDDVQVVDGVEGLHGCPPGAAVEVSGCSLGTSLIVMVHCDDCATRPQSNQYKLPVGSGPRCDGCGLKPQEVELFREALPASRAFLRKHFPNWTGSGATASYAGRP